MIFLLSTIKSSEYGVMHDLNKNSFRRKKKKIFFFRLLKIRWGTTSQFKNSTKRKKHKKDLRSYNTITIKTYTIRIKTYTITIKTMDFIYLVLFAARGLFLNFLGGGGWVVGSTTLSK